MIRCDRQRELNKLKRLQLGSSLAARTAARCIRELANDIADLNARIAALDREIAQMLAEHENPLADLQGAGTNLAATIIAQAGDVRRFRNAGAFARFCGAAPIPCGSGKQRTAIACTAAATDNSTPRSTASRSSSNATTPTPRPTSLARSPKERSHEKPAEPSSATSRTSYTAAFTPGQIPLRA